MIVHAAESLYWFNTTEPLYLIKRLPISLESRHKHGGSATGEISKELQEKLVRTCHEKGWRICGVKSTRIGVEGKEWRPNRWWMDSVNVDLREKRLSGEEMQNLVGRRTMITLILWCWHCCNCVVQYVVFCLQRAVVEVTEERSGRVLSVPTQQWTLVNIHRSSSASPGTCLLYTSVAARTHTPGQLCRVAHI